MRKLSSTDIKATLKISDCDLMHLRERGQLSFEKRGRAYFYDLPSNISILDHPLGEALINWYEDRHDFIYSNAPVNANSKLALEFLLF